MAAPNAIGSEAGARPTGGEVRSSTRWLALFIIPFLVVASAILWFWPDQTGRLFAWPIKPPMTAMLLSTAYVGGIYFFVRVALAKRWDRVKVGFLPVATFSSLLCVATVLHWDRFTHGHVSFWTWVALYFIAPPLVVAAWWSNRRHDPGVRAHDDPAIPLPLRWLIGALGLLVGAFGVLLFVAPGVVIPGWPWSLTPLTARVVSAILAMQAVAVGIALDERWSAARVMFEAELVTVPLIALAVLRSRNDFAAGASSMAVFLSGLTVLWLAMGSLCVFMHRRARALGAMPAESRS